MCEKIENSPQKLVSVFCNPNTSGSKGFTRGVTEVRKALPKTGVTHVVFMDDDVELIPETFYILYALLTLLANYHKDDVIAGRMFWMDNRKA